MIAYKPHAHHRSRPASQGRSGKLQCGLKRIGMGALRRAGAAMLQSFRNHSAAVRCSRMVRRFAAAGHVVEDNAERWRSPVERT